MSKPHPPMTAKALKHWLDQMDWNPDTGASALGLSRSTVYAYLNGSTAIPRTVQLACKALAVDKSLPAAAAVAEPPGSMDPIYPFPNAVPKMSPNR